MQSNQFPFIGRQDGLNAFHSLLSLSAQKNVLYIQAVGGMGKTRLLRKIIESCQEKPNWHVQSPDSAIIDFFELHNQSVAGLRHSIIDKIGEDYFIEFKNSEDELHIAETRLGKETTHSDSQTISTIVALRHRNDDLFFKNLKRALRGHHIVLLFDTFEVVNRRRVGRWFLEQFIPRAERAIIVFAGRPPRPVLPTRVHFFELQPWKDMDAIQYFRERGWHIPKEVALNLHDRTGGHPLLMDMLIYLTNPQIPGSLDELMTIPRGQMEWALTNRLIHTQKPEHYVIQEMAYLKRRFDPRIFAHRQKYQAYPDIKDYDTLSNNLLSGELSFIVKYRQEGQVLTLHDEVQRMIEQHGYHRDWNLAGPRPGWEDLCQELYSQVVEEWYPQIIQQTQSEKERELLKAEQLGYELSYNPEYGLKLYEQYFEEIKEHARFDFNELIWGEVFDRLTTGKFSGHEYELCFTQADWLWFMDQFDTAAELYRLIIEEYTRDHRHAIQKLEALASFGHASMRLRRYEQALEAFEKGLVLAESEGNKVWLSAFQQNKGQLLQAQHSWGEAERWLKDAVTTAETIDLKKEPLALASVHLGQLQALLGKYNDAILNCGRAVALRQEVFLHPEQENPVTEDEQDRYYYPVMEQSSGYFSEEGRRARLGEAYVRLGDAYRYSGVSNRQKAQRNYQKAIEHLSSISQHVFWSEALQGLGNIFHGKGVEAYEAGIYLQAVTFQSQAFEKLNEAITLCRQYGLKQQLPKALHRLAHVIFEGGRLEKIDALSQDKNLKLLSKQISNFLLPEEDSWIKEIGYLRESAEFTNLDTIAKAQRLFEVSSLEAERLEDFNISLDSLVQACEIALYRRRFDDVRAYDRLAKIPSQAYQQNLFSALITLVLANLDLYETRPDRALARYRENFPVVAQSGGYGRYLLGERLARLGQRLLDMPVEQGLHWCDNLIQEWTQKGLNESHPELIAQMWEYRNLILEEAA